MAGAAPISGRDFSFSNAFYFQLFLILLAAFTVRLCTSTWGYSGEGKPPMFGDLEAQRHWMEITINLPVEEWYEHTQDNDLQYWGLDYPPLTAYHMMLNGKIAQHVQPDMVELGSSRGIETEESKLFMRSSVLLMDLLLFLPASVAYFVMQRSKKEEETDVLVYITVMVGYPGLILVDHGHFQYNNVSLGLVVLATLALALDRDLVASVLFCLSLNYKQMELYHALPFFIYLLAGCVHTGLGDGLRKLLKLSLTVVATFAIVWLPFLFSIDSMLAVVQRLFPVNRGLYEDKVANFWCAISVLIKLRELFPQNIILLICLISTVLALLPSCVYLFRYPTIRNFHFCMIISALVFFLFSYHVHEKSILIAAVPACLLIKSDPLAVIWFLVISVFSMLPLLIKDALCIPALALVALFWLFVNHFLQPGSRGPPEFHALFNLSLLGAACLSVATIFIPPPARYPDIFTLLVAVYSCLHFMLFCVYFHMRLFNIYYTFSTKLSKKKFDFETSPDPVPTVSNDVPRTRTLRFRNNPCSKKHE